MSEKERKKKCEMNMVTQHNIEKTICIFILATKNVMNNKGIDKMLLEERN